MLLGAYKASKYSFYCTECCTLVSRCTALKWLIYKDFYYFASISESSTTILNPESYGFNQISTSYTAGRRNRSKSYLYPFEKVKIPKSNVERQYLNKQQSEDLESLDLSRKPHAVVHRDMFLFSVCAGGLWISDVLFLQWKSYNEEPRKITKAIQKTQKQHTFKIGTKAVEIVNKYKPKNPNPDAFISPVPENPEEYLWTNNSKA